MKVHPFQSLKACLRRGAEASGGSHGAQGRDRTTDTAIFSRMLYQLSYLGVPRKASKKASEPAVYSGVRRACPPGFAFGVSQVTTGGHAAQPGLGVICKPLERKAFGSATNGLRIPRSKVPDQRFPLGRRRDRTIRPPGLVRFDVVSKAGPDQRIPPVLLGDADRLPQFVEIATAQLQYSVADSIEKHGKPRELRTAFFGQKR